MSSITAQPSLLAASYENGAIFIANDNHVFPDMVEAGAYNDLLQTFLLHGMDSSDMEQALSRNQHFRWQD